jgi:hypothetical protein
MIADTAVEKWAFSWINTSAARGRDDPDDPYVSALYMANDLWFEMRDHLTAEGVDDAEIAPFMHRVAARAVEIALAGDQQLQ